MFRANGTSKTNDKKIKKEAQKERSALAALKDDQQRRLSSPSGALSIDIPTSLNKVQQRKNSKIKSHDKGTRHLITLNIIINQLWRSFRDNR